jgi:hypothetical protein
MAFTRYDALGMMVALLFFIVSSPWCALKNLPKLNFFAHCWLHRIECKVEGNRRETENEQIHTIEIRRRRTASFFITHCRIAETTQRFK